MPVLESTDHITPKSALRYRPIEDEAARSSTHPAATPPPVAQRASRLRPRAADTEDEIAEWRRAEDEEPRTGGRVARPSKKLPKAPGSVRRGSWGFGGRAHPLLYLGLGMLAMLTLWTLLMLAVNWWTTTMDDIHYGRPRTFQTDAYVGQNEAGTPSHFLALNYNSRIEIIEFPGGDAAHARIYLGPQLYGPGDTLIPVTLSFVDVSGNHKPDMIVHFQSSRIIFVNDQGSFRPPTGQEQQMIEQYLVAHGQ